MSPNLDQVQKPRLGMVGVLVALNKASNGGKPDS